MMQPFLLTGLPNCLMVDCSIVSLLSGFPEFAGQQ